MNRTLRMDPRIEIRVPSFELLRVVAMAMIVLHHFLVHILWPSEPGMVASGDLLPGLAFANAFIVVGVNLFVMISGYFSILLSWQSFFRLWLCVLFYQVLLIGGYELYTIHAGIEGVSWRVVFLPLVLFSKGGYWYLTYYFVLMLFSPLLNKALRRMNLYVLRQCVAVLVVFTCYSGFVLGNSNPDGYNAIQFFFLYVMGHYAGREPYIAEMKRSRFIQLFLIGSLLYGLFTALLAARGYIGSEYPRKLFAYNNPVVLLTSFALFCWFSRLDIRHRIVNWIAASMLGVYLIQESSLGKVVYEKMATLFASEGFSAEFIGLLCANFAGLFVVTILIDQLRKLICTPLTDKLVSLIPEQFQTRFQ